MVHGKLCASQSDAPSAGYQGAIGWIMQKSRNRLRRRKHIVGWRWCLHKRTQSNCFWLLLQYGQAAEKWRLSHAQERPHSPLPSKLQHVWGLAQMGHLSWAGTHLQGVHEEFDRNRAKVASRNSTSLLQKEWYRRGKGKEEAERSSSFEEQMTKTIIMYKD